MNSERLQQIQELYHSARERDPGERGVFLARACRGDQELRLEVESLLGQDGSDGTLGIMERPAMEVAARLLAEETVTQLGVGEQLGPYQIEALLGTGGMGQVYKARDTRLGRAVAIKIAHQQFSERFEREARAISALNHPHICTVHDVGPNYLVMELVEGETLATRIKKGALAIGDVLRYGAQIADALADAHAKNITHRDLKPANVMIAKSGAKVLDFGLAKLFEPGDTLTQTGAVMGTPGYMAPEQLAGKNADARTDIYALGLTLYEMATGRRLVAGQPTAMDGLPSQFAHVVERCLAREPDDRWQTARDVKAELDWAAKIQPATPVAVVKSSSRRRHAMVAVGVVSIAAAWSVWQFRQTPTDQPVTRLQIEPPNGGRFVTSGNIVIGGMALSHDGGTAAFVATVGEQTGLWVRSLDSSSARLLPGTDGAGYPFWSPDGKSIAFVARGKVQRIDVAGGLPVTAWEARQARGGVWLPDGSVVLGGDQSGLFQAPALGGSLTQLTELSAPNKEVVHESPQLLPGNRLLYLALSSIPGRSAIYAISLDKPDERVRVLSTNVNALYASGYLLWWNGGTLVAQEFDPATFKLGGEPHPLAEQVTIHEPRMNVAVSPNGYLLYDASGLRNQLQWLGPSGKPLAQAGELGDISSFRISPDGRRIAVIPGSLSAGNAVWVVEENSLASRVTSQGTGFLFPIWSPDGQNMALTIRSPELNLFRMGSNGSGDPERLTQSPNVQFVADWSRDGRSILFHEQGPGSQWDLWVLRVTPQGVLEETMPRPYLRGPSNESFGRFSPEPNPRWVAYQSDETGRYEVYIQAFPVPHGKFHISARGGSFPTWGPDGRELYYEALDNKLIAVSLKFRADSVEPSAWRELFVLPPSQSGAGTPPYDIAPDGKRFLVRVEVQNDPGLTLVTNWPALIKKGAATR
jgi:dipeptidyl aminopeptidase/acylaminoacyl peptidase/predicted Ser/Thr protein kinase